MGIGRYREIDHFVPWSQSGDDGLFNLVAACRQCNNRKRSILAGPDFLESLITRNTGWTTDRESLADERSWPADAFAPPASPTPPTSTHREPGECFVQNSA